MAGELRPYRVCYDEFDRLMIDPNRLFVCGVSEESAAANFATMMIGAYPWVRRFFQDGCRVRVQSEGRGQYRVFEVTADAPRTIQCAVSPVE